MTAEAKELMSICDLLPADKRTELADFARFLLSQQDDSRWEQIIADTKPRPKLDEFLKSSRAEGSEPLDLNRL